MSDITSIPSMEIQLSDALDYAQSIIIKYEKEIKRLKAENEELRKALNPMTNGTDYITHEQVRRAYELLGKNYPLD